MQRPCHGRKATGLQIRVFIAALAVRWTYDAAIYLTMGNSGFMTDDAVGYLGYANEFASGFASGSIAGWQWLGPSPYMMPLISWFMTAHVLAFGSGAPLAYVMNQGILDAVICLLIYQTAAIIDPRIALPAAVAAIVNPTQIVMAGFFYTDAPFLLFVSIFLLGSVRWLQKPSWSAAITIGCGLGAAAMIRILVAPWTAALLIFLLAVLVVRRRLRAMHVVQMAAAGLIFGITIAPLFVRNIVQHQSWALTAQSGMHLNWFVVPLIKETKDGTPWAQSYEEMARRTRERFGQPAPNPFEQSRRETQIAIEELKKIAVLDIAKAWFYGAAINLGSPAIILSPHVSTLPRTGFYATPGTSMLEKIRNFLFHSGNPLYGWILLTGVVGVAAIRLIQVVGVFAVLRSGSDHAVFFLFVGWCIFILAVNGPLASPKYRLPMEPALAIFTGAGISFMSRKRERTSSRPQQTG